MGQLMIRRGAVSTREALQFLAQPGDRERASGRLHGGGTVPHPCPVCSSKFRIQIGGHVARMLCGVARSQRHPLKHNENICNTCDMKTAPNGAVENARNADDIRVFSVAGGLGFEPRLTESESAVLPLNYPPIASYFNNLAIWTKPQTVAVQMAPRLSGRHSAEHI